MIHSTAHSTNRRRRATIAASVPIVLVLLTNAMGCGSGSSRGDKPEAERTVTPDAFARTATDTELAEPRTPALSSSNPDLERGEFVVRPGERSADLRPVPRARTVAPEGLALIEAKVGDINGKPIYATSFFEPIEARLIANAERLRLAAWRGEAVQIIDGRLTGMMVDELLRAEALAALSAQQRQGLRAFLSNFRKNILTENLGSAQLAEKRGQSVDAAMREKEIETLVGLTLFQEVNKRVHVSWRDIQQEYEKQYEKFNPPPTAVLRFLRVPTEETDSINAIRTQIREGVDFEVIASEAWNTFDPDDGGLIRSEFEGAYADAEFFGSDVLNEQARMLSMGQTSQGFELGRYTCWIKLEGIEQESVSLYDAQLGINVDLNRQRRETARQEYITQLFERARVNNRETLIRRLLVIAEDRYGPE